MPIEDSRSRQFPPRGYPPTSAELTTIYELPIMNSRRLHGASYPSPDEHFDGLHAVYLAGVAMGQKIELSR